MTRNSAVAASRRIASAHAQHADADRGDETRDHEDRRLGGRVASDALELRASELDLIASEELQVITDALDEPSEPVGLLVVRRHFHSRGAAVVPPRRAGMSRFGEGAERDARARSALVPVHARTERASRRLTGQWRRVSACMGHVSEAL